MNICSGRLSLSCDIRFFVSATSKGSDQPADTRSLIRAFACRLQSHMTVTLLTEHHLEFLSLNGGCAGSLCLHLPKYNIVGNLMSRNI